MTSARVCMIGSGGLVFFNPFCSMQDQWLKRAHDHWAKKNASTILCLVPAKTDTKFFHRTLAIDAEAYFLERRPRLFREDGTFEPTMVGTMLVMFGATAVEKMRFAERS